MDQSEKLGEEKRNESMEQWLSECENIIHECDDAGLLGYSGYEASLKYINAIDPLLPVYAKVRYAKLKPDVTPSILEQCKCICGDFHPFIDCPYILSSKDPASWKADPKMEAKFEKVKKTSENVELAIKRAVEQSSQEAGAIGHSPDQSNRQDLQPW
ncbi:dimethyladenosine transferase [Aspergillus udagawae]|uniref:Dimethyladenosine transferase n=1 Tax=Aspergillus udagawae TaxID=91492 RepID=A0ABQ1A5D0_9EURO|nr:dimethyladenosine transferase [Aspergillus udagawae]GFF73882.1 dimethyladenosine transferase [Aspergillus udagawae]